FLEYNNPNAFMYRTPTANACATAAKPHAGPTPTPVQPARQIPTPPDAGCSASARRYGTAGQGDTQLSTRFLCQDDERLRESKAILMDENAVLRKKHSGLQAQLDRLRSQLRPLEDALQELLYLPAVQEEHSQGMVSRLFGIMGEVGGMKRALICCD